MENENLNLGKMYYNEENFPKATSYFLKAIDINNKDFESLLWLGCCYYEQELVDKAIYYFNKADEIKSNNVNYLIAIGLCYFKIKQYNEALKYFKRGNDTYPLKENFLIELANTYIKLEKFKKAIESCEELNKLNSLSSYASKYKGIALLKLKELDSAIESFKIAFRLNPKDNEILKYEGFAYIESNNYLEGIECFEKAFEISENYCEYYNCMALAKNKKGEYEEALKYCEKGLEIENNNPDLLITRGDIYLNKKNIKEAGDSYKESLNMNKNNLKCILANVKFFEINNNMNRAIEYMNNAISLNPENKKLYFIKANLHEQHEQLEDAIDCVDEVIDLDNEDLKALELRGDLYEKIGEYSKAKENYERILSFDKYNDRVIDKKAKMNSILETFNRGRERNSKISFDINDQNNIPDEIDFPNRGNILSKIDEIDFHDNSYISYFPGNQDLRNKLNKFHRIKYIFMKLDETYHTNDDIIKNKIDNIREDLITIENEMINFNMEAFINNSSLNNNDLLERISSIENQLKNIIKEKGNFTFKYNDIQRRITFFIDKIESLRQDFNQCLNSMNDYICVYKLEEGKKKNLEDFIFAFINVLSNVYIFPKVIEKNLVRIEDRNVPQSLLCFGISMIPIVGETLSNSAHSLWEFILKKSVKRKAKLILRNSNDNVLLNRKIEEILKKIISNDSIRLKIIDIEESRLLNFSEDFISKIKSFLKNSSDFFISELFTKSYETPGKKLGFIHANIIISALYNSEDVMEIFPDIYKYHITIENSILPKINISEQSNKNSINQIEYSDNNVHKTKTNVIKSDLEKICSNANENIKIQDNKILKEKKTGCRCSIL